MNNYLDTTDDLERDGKDERVQKGRDGLEDGDVLGKRAVPNKTKDESADENIEREDEKLGNHLGARLGMSDLVKHFITY